jgi:hypothetical protein
MYSEEHKMIQVEILILSIMARLRTSEQRAREKLKAKEQRVAAAKETAFREMRKIDDGARRQ